MIVEATNGRQGIDKAKEIIPDIIISDIMMPDVDGYRLCRELKQDIKTSHVPIILLSVKYTEAEITRGLETGADDYITKPFNMEILLTRVRNLTGQSPNKFIQSYRLKWSLDLLKSNAGNVTEVAFQVGFSSSAYFTKCFKEKF